jgi:hypothetical protein
MQQTTQVTAPRQLAGRNLGSVIRDSFFQYAANLTFDATGVNNLTPVIPIQSDAHFLCVQTMMSNSSTVGNITATTATSYVDILHGGAIVQLTDGGSQRLLSLIPVPASCLFGSAKEPYIWPFTHLFRANTFIGVSATGSVAGAAGIGMTAANLRLVFAGFKVAIGSFPELGL